MGFLEMVTCDSSTPVLPLVGVLVFCVPIPTSHYSSSYKAKEWDVDACALLTAWFPVCRAGVVCPVHHLSASAAAAAGSVVVAAAAAAGSFVVTAAAAGSVVVVTAI